MSEVALQEYLERLIAEQDRLRQAEIAGLRAELNVRLNAADIALDLKSVELERRLEMLNGEAGRLAKVLAESVPREVWGQNQKTLEEWRSQVDKQLNTAAGKNQQTVYLVALAIVAVQILLQLFVK